jgi:RHH-type proline utilization regulon transcriptional repressor/proline dehydrogenase/delta 1-pyrroline-5-carboxylate dehydrogenase
VRIGLASHNLFDIAYALLLRAHHGVEDRVELEMLEGMANEQARTLSKEHSPVLFYAPVVRMNDFHSAIAYLVRRLDENTSPENFLANMFSMTPGDALWQEQETRFRDACAKIEDIHTGPRRTQNRSQAPAAHAPECPFENAVDTDWVLPANRNWLHHVLSQYQLPQEPLPLQVAGQFLYETPVTSVPNPSDTSELYHHHLATATEVERALTAASESNWHTVPAKERATLLTQVGNELERTRGTLIAAMRKDAAKTAPEADVEITEAIDFATYYGNLLATPGFEDGTTPSPLGPVVVTPPWNFPCAIPCGGLLAALAAGNPVILKPAPETVLTAWEMVQCLWRAGIPQDACQFLPCPDNEIGQALVSDARLGAVILTGASATADLFRSWNPTRPLFAETSGKNALIITAASDPDLAIKDLVRSAFGHSGQKCSAASLGLIESSLYDSPGFLKQLRDAAASLPVGPSHDPAALATPLIREPSPELLRGLTQLDPGESWLLEPREVTPTLWSPGIRLGVKAGSWIHQTELFGPVLALIRVGSLEEAISIQNSSAFGLTGGIHSLDPEEIAQWRESVEVGNAYINRPITGAVVRRQPFGGWKNSSVGPGAKAGGPNYLTQFSHWSETTLPTQGSDPSPAAQRQLDQLLTLFPKDSARLTAAARSYAHWWKEELSCEHDPSQLHGEDNHFRYRPAPRTIFRADPDTAPLDLALVSLAIKTVRGTLEISAEDNSPCHELAQTLGLSVTTESSKALKERLEDSPLTVLRATHPDPILLEAPLHLHANKPLANGRLELLCYFHEQSISETTHRHGRIGPA